MSRRPALFSHTPQLAVVVPVLNERENLRALHEHIDAALQHACPDFELILVNDGSTDGSEQLLDELVSRDPRVRVVHLRRQYGQTAALAAGLEAARAPLVATMDADLQNDARDLPAMMASLEQDYDLVHGWRVARQDTYWTRRLPSQLANHLISRVTGLRIHDLGCTLKVMRRELAGDLNLYGELHRFIPVLAHWQGARILEMPTRHHPRRFGHTKYGLGRTLRVLLDLITVKYLIQYSSAPMRLFGTLGIGIGAASTGLGLLVVLMKWLSGFDITGNPLLYVSLAGLLASLQFFSLGLLGEMSSRTYYESQGRKPYAIRRIRQADPPCSAAPPRAA